MNRKYINIAASVLFMSLISCSDELKSPADNVLADENCITFSITTEGAGAGTRSYGTAGHINQLIYQIFKENKTTGEFELDKYYLKESDTYNGLTFCKAIENYNPKQSYTIKLIPNPADDADQKYKIVFWAQAKDSKYFNLSEFPKITVNYATANDEDYNSKNNNEERDGFHCVGEFTAAGKGSVTQFVLKRPFAQINVGTSGWDYEGSAKVEPKLQVVKYSRIRIDGVAKTFDALNNKASSDESNITFVTFDWAKIPAYRYLDDDVVASDALTGVYSTDRGVNGVFTTSGVEEEFLKIKLNRPANPKLSTVAEADSDSGYDGYDDSEAPENYGYAGYIGWTRYDYFCATSETEEELLYNIFTETFKYLSMCYVLVPFDAENETGSTVEVEFDCTTTLNEDGTTSGVFANDGKNVMSLSNVPVGNNCRTNIIATDGTGFFMNANQMHVAIYEQTFGDYYKELDANDDDNGWGDANKNPNDDYKWPEEDIDPDYGRPHVVIPVLLNAEGTKLIDAENNIIHNIKYFGDDVEFSIDLNKDYKENSAYTYEFYLGDEKIEKEIDPQTGTYDFSFTPSQINKIVESNGITPTSIELDEYETDYKDGKIYDKKKEVPAIKYHSVNFTVKTITDDKELFYDDLNIEIRWYSSYKFTFSGSSEDEGYEIMEAINTNERLGSNANPACAEDEKDYHFLTNYESVNSKHLTVTSRKDKNNTDGSNHRIFAFPDHLRLRGLGRISANSNGQIGHYITLNGLKENCKITAKIGRDAGQDNSPNQNAETEYNRYLHINWGQSENDDSKYYWEGWDPKEYMDRLDSTSSTSKTTYSNTESKIMDSVTTEFSGDSQDVKIYVDESGHTYYWIMLSEPDGE